MSRDNKPLLLKSALLLSTIGSSVALIAYFYAALFYNHAVETIQSITNITSTDGTSPLYFSIFGILYSASLCGVIYMYKFRKKGFWIYSMAQLIILILSLVWLGKNSFSTTNTIFTSLFILIYLSFYRLMR